MKKHSPRRTWTVSLALSLMAVSLAGCAQGPPRQILPGPMPIPVGEDPLVWEAEIARTLAARPDVAEPVVFLGSSSIRLWETLTDDMAPVPVVNHGFGGSKIFDAVYWLEAILDGVEPRALAVFSGTNDLAGDAPRDPKWIAARFDELVLRLRSLGHDVPVVFIAISPTPARERHLDLVLRTNALIAVRCAADPMLHFVDSASELLDAEGRPDPRWFVGDRLHLNASGYALWKERIRTALVGALGG